jgi:hypothetical protein
VCWASAAAFGAAAYRDVEDGEDWRRAEEVSLPWPPEFPTTDADPMGDGVAETLMLRDLANAVRHRTPPDESSIASRDRRTAPTTSTKATWAGPRRVMASRPYATERMTAASTVGWPGRGVVEDREVRPL